MKTAISVPNTTYERVVRMARQMGVSRSELFSRAAERYLDEADDARVTELVNEVLARDPAAQESNFAAAEASRARLLEGDDW
ncbi:MAG TPA: ribbon-helix-helix protein, CopG family [Actinotalea sp.]|nr:ribbon-helix-helix protein, CopG family [Actinotalea sp.]